MYRKIICKSCILIAVLVAVLAVLSPLTVYKTAHRAKLIQGLYDSDDDYDVLMIGSSHMNGGLDPNVLWKQYGITSFNYATGGQTLELSYFILREALKKHEKPGAVVVDVFYSGMTNPYGESGLLSNAIDNLKLSRNKAEAIFNCVPPGEWPFYFLPALKYHFRWSSLTAQDFNFDLSAYYYSKGFGAGTTRWGKDDATYGSTDRRLAIPRESLEYLQKIVDLSRQEGFPLILVNFPADYTNYNQMDGWVDDCEAMLNSVADFAAERGVPFLDYCDSMESIGIDFPNDMNNASHLNQWGACKLSSAFGAYLKQHYQLEDHRSDPAYAQWDRDYLLSQAHDVLD